MKNLIFLLPLIGVVFGCDDDEITPTTVKLDYYEESFNIPDLDFQPQLKTTYEYDDDGRLTRYTFYGYDPTADELLQQRHFEFTYEDGSVNKIEGFLVNKTTPYIKYTYQYDANSVVTKIAENNFSVGVNSEAIFSYPSADVITVAYTFSNGGSFEYEMNLESDNVLSDKTTRGSQLCSDGEYTYDDHPNPFKNLGYLDYMLINVSANNKLTESVNYVGCAFPNLKPESYEYVYNSDGYPTEVVTKYVPHDGVTPTSTRKFYYKVL